MTNFEVAGEVKAFSRTLDYEALLSGAVGAQDAVTIHEILPVGWVVTDVDVETETAFNGAGTRALDIGWAADPDGIVAALDVKAAGFKAPTVVKHRVTTAQALVAVLTTATDNPTAGRVRITVRAYPATREE